MPRAAFPVNLGSVGADQMTRPPARWASYSGCLPDVPIDSLEAATADVAAHLVSALSSRYRVERELGQGGLATVYLAEDLKQGRHVAIKVLLPELSAILGGERFLAEIKVTANLQHPHILGLIGSGEADGLLYYVMPHVAGGSLRARLLRERQLPVHEALRLAHEVASRRFEPLARTATLPRHTA
jgi:hypothetical protein